jgi:hypothetical protein
MVRQIKRRDNAKMLRLQRLGPFKKADGIVKDVMCAQWVLAGEGSTARVARCKRRSWLSSGRIIMRWRVSPTGLRYVYSVVCTMLMRAMHALCGASGGANDRLFPVRTYLITYLTMQRFRFAQRPEGYLPMTSLCSAQMGRVGACGPSEQRESLQPQRRLPDGRSRKGQFAFAAANAVALISLPSPLAAQSAESDAQDARIDAILATPSLATPVPQSNLIATAPGLEQ